MSSFEALFLEEEDVEEVERVMTDKDLEVVNDIIGRCGN